jgi:hypothetical protein
MSSRADANARLTIAQTTLRDSEPQRREEYTALASSAADSLIVSRARRYTRRVDHDLDLAPRRRMLLWAQIAGHPGVVSVADPKHWPDSTESSYIVLMDSVGRPRLARIVPFSESGDYDIENTFYFDDAGRTTVFERYAGIFNSGCDVKREISRSYFNTAHRLVERDYRTEDGHGRPAVTRDCDLNYRYPYVIYDTWAALIAGEHLPAVAATRRNH